MWREDNVCHSVCAADGGAEDQVECKISGRGFGLDNVHVIVRVRRWPRMGTRYTTIGPLERSNVRQR